MLSAKFESDESRLQLQGPHWNSTKWLVSLDSIMNGLVRYFVRKTKKRLGQSNFDDFQYEITLHPVIQLGGEQGRYARFDENGSTQIEQLLDLFPNTVNSTSTHFAFILIGKSLMFSPKSKSVQSFYN